MRPARRPVIAVVIAAAVFTWVAVCFGARLQWWEPAIWTAASALIIAAVCLFIYDN